MKSLTIATIILLSGLFFLVTVLPEWSFTQMTRRENMQGWHDMCGMMGWMPKQGVSPQSLPEASSKGALLFADYCSQCHALPNPSRHSSSDWRILVDRMDNHMNMMSWERGMWGRRWMGDRDWNVKKIPAGVKDEIVNYLAKHSLQALDESSALSSKAGFAEFNKVCSNCHALPDPSAHTKSEWPQVYQRMVGHMKEMGMDLPTAEEATMLLKFLDNGPTQ